MGLGNLAATIGGTSRNVIVAADGAGNLANAHVAVDINGAAIAPALAALQPALNADGGALTHIMNFPATLTGASTLAAGIISVGTSATLVVSARYGRSSLVITASAAATLYFSSTTGVSSTTGAPFYPKQLGDSYDFGAFSGPIYAVAAAATSVTFAEIY